MAGSSVASATPARPCPICGKPSRAPHRPFCSARCADIDLNRWLSGAYVVAAESAETEDDEALPEGEDGN